MGRRRILVIDDDPDLVESLRAVLEDEGHDVGLASDGETAMEACRGRGGDRPGDGRYDLVLLDLHLGSGPLAGQPLLRALRALLGPTPLVLISGEPGLDRLAPRLGADGWLEKPFSIETLLGLLDRLGPAAPSLSPPQP